MKKLLILLLALSLFLCSCEDLINDFMGGSGNGEPSTDTGSSDDTGENEKDPPSEEDENDPTDTPTYEDVERRPASSYTVSHYGFKNDAAILKLQHPGEWSLQRSGNIFDVVRDGEIIGYLFGGAAPDKDVWTIIRNESQLTRDIRVTKIIEQNKGTAEFRYRYVYKYPSGDRARTITLTAACAEIDSKTENRLYSNVATVERVTSDTVGMLSFDRGPSSVLILGNSFVGTSNIGNILREMINNNGKTCSVEAISRGYASVATYINDPFVLANIRSGNYDAVFICGFYDTAEVLNLAVLKEACDASATKLVIFPAHNESATLPSSAHKKYPSTFLLDWKAELDYLIARRNVDRWDLCINDMHLHSTPLAGYVGAHMIYRAMYGELPEAPMQISINQSYIDSILGDYAYVGDGKAFDDDKITYLN